MTAFSLKEVTELTGHPAPPAEPYVAPVGRRTIPLTVV